MLMIIIDLFFTRNCLFIYFFFRKKFYEYSTNNTHHEGYIN